MPTTDAVNTAAELFYNYPPLLTRLSADGDPSTTDSDVQTTLTATSIVRSAGGQQLDYADLEWKVTSHLINRSQPAEFSRAVDVLAPDTKKTRLHIGDYVTETEAVDETEELTAQSQTRAYHFGEAFFGQKWWDELSSDDTVTEVLPVFNPRIDGRILGNRSDKKHTDAGHDAYYFIHPEAGLTAAAQTETDQVPSEWDLKEAVLAMCWQCNPSETHIDNPARADLSVLDNAPTLEDVVLENGRHLPYYLDRLLQPLGFNWHVKYDTGTVVDPTTTESEKYDKSPPKIVVFEKGVGTSKKLYMQAPNAVLDLDDSNVNQYRISRRIGDSVNHVRVIGDVERAEVTIELVRGWAATHDSKTASDLNRADSSSDYEAYPTVWRLWVANEAGDYVGLRTEITAALDLSTVFSRWVTHRRNAFDPFTYQGGAGKKERRQIFLEYTTDGGTTWQPVDDNFGQPFIMPDQIGVLFQGDTPPEDLIAAGDDAGVRITCVVEGDARLSSVKQRQSHAVNGRDVQMVVDVPQKFRKHWVQATGTYASVLSGDAAGAETVDDTTKIGDYAEDLRDDNEVAEIDCSFNLPGIHLDYEIGDLITEIDGREVSLDQASDTAPTPRYPQIIRHEVHYDPSPRTRLVVDRGVRKAPAFVVKPENFRRVS